MAYVQDSLPESLSQRYVDYELEPTQMSQPVYSQASQFPNSQVEPRRKYWAILIPTNPQHAILKIPWTKHRLQIGRGDHAGVGNDAVLQEKRVSNRHCRIYLGLHGGGTGGGKGATSHAQAALVQALKDGEAEPEVWIEDMKSSNGTFVNGVKVQPRRILQHGDEISLGHVGTADNHEVRYIFRSVGCKGAKVNAANNPGQVYERYQMLETGTFAEVKKAVDIETGDLRAIKQIVTHRFGNNDSTLNLFQREIDICMQLQHENICRLLDSYTDPQQICLVLEFIDGGDLLDYIIKWEGPGLPETEAADFTFQICRAMAYCHDNGVTHRDLKPENILLTKETATQGRIIKIADFGLAKMQHTDKTMLVSMVGTPQYLAPEVVMQTKARPGYESVVDSWSIGIIVYSMLTKALPFDESEELTMEQRIRQRYEMDFDREPLHTLEISDQAIDFIARLLERDPSKRMTMREALEHVWLAGPSSLPNESASQVLGGDSTWNIQSFDSYDDDLDDDGDDALDERTTGYYSRPMTESVTNLESMGSGGDGVSQPMEQLRLSTATAPAYNDLEITNGGDDEDEQMDGLAVADRNVREMTVAMEAEANGNGLYTATTARPPPVTARTKGASLLSVKRKMDFFSSGSLSPPPPTPPTELDATPKVVAGSSTRRLTRATTAKAAVATPQTRGSKAAEGPTPPRAKAAKVSVTQNENWPPPRKSKRLN